jgi:hypothetical protein
MNITPILRPTMALALLCAACGGIDVTRVATDDDAPLTGVPWNLAMTQYTLKVTRQLSTCDGALQGSFVVEIATGKVIDEQQKYLLDSNGWWATSDITSTLATDGTSTGLNAASANAAAQIISNVVSLAAQVAVLAARETAETKSAKAPVAPSCTEEAAAALTALADGKLEEDSKKATKALNAATAKVATLTQQAQNDKAYKAQLATAIGDQAKAQETFDKAQKAYNDQLKAVTHQQTIRWPLKADVFRTKEPFGLPQDARDKWIKQKTAPVVGEEKFGVHLALFRRDQEGNWTTPPVPLKGDISIGVPVRMPRIGRLLVCTGDKVCDDSLPADWVAPDQTISVGKDEPVLQMGRLYNIRVRGGAFKSESAAIALDANGLPTTITVSEKVAAAAALTGALAQTATQINAIPGQVAAAQLARTNAQLNQINADNALVTARANAQTVAATSRSQAELNMYNAQAAVAAAQVNAQANGPNAALAAQLLMLNTQNSIAGAQGTSATASQVSALNAQTNLLNAQAAQINAAAALAKAQATVP